MSDDPSGSSPTSARPKPVRTSTGSGLVRPRSPQAGPSDHQNGDTRPQKRARKAINCAPCRQSKLKCDRNRPCSSCVLRGTTAMCYQDGSGPDGGEVTARVDEPHARIDPAQEFARLRQSINQLESYVFPNYRPAASQRRASDAPVLHPKKEPVEPDVEKPVPGMLGHQSQVYAGPTSAMQLLSGGDTRSDETDSRHHSVERNSPDFPGLTQDYDRDLLAMLPSLDIIDGLINYYFEYCNWMYRHINQVAFNQHWERFKSGSSADRLVLATACAILAIATFYLPPQHHLLESYHETHETMGVKFYEVSTIALQRRQAESKSYNLDLVELLLIRAHYLTLLKKDSEEIWYLSGEVVRIGIAMGLHRDPGKWRMHRDLAERRRWAWWHIVLLERWQSFMLGRPMMTTSHHFDTQLPSYCDPAVDKTGRLYLPNIALFRLSYLLGDIIDDAVSVRPVPYDNVMANDRALTQWMENLPSELDLDEYRLARNLASPNASMRRLGVQSVIIRTSYYHIRFTLHRPYATVNPSSHNSTSKNSSTDPPKSAQSLEIAVSAADKLITMVGQSRPDFLANASLAVPGHMNWGPFHCFSAAMFFSFQLIANPDQPGAGLFRASISKAMVTLQQARGMTVADKAYDILEALSPLYAAEQPQQTPEERETQRSQILGVVRKLAFPYHDSRDPSRFDGSPGSRMAGSPANSNSLSPPMTNLISGVPQQYDGLQSHAMSSVRTPSMYSNGTPTMPGMQGMTQSPQQLSPTVVTSLSSTSSPPYTSQPYGMTQPQGYDQTRYSHYISPVDEATMWGAAVGFEHGEWAQFLDGLRPDPIPSNGRLS